MKTLHDHFLASNDGSTYKWIHYFPIYESIFSKFKEKKIKILEIGVLKGGSLKLWKDYFGESATVYGIDINPDSKQYESEGIEIFIGDQSDKDFLSRVVQQTGGFDIVIDDGAHTNFTVMNSFEALYEHTYSYYIVEDVHALYWSNGLYSLGRDVSMALSEKNLKSLVKVAEIIKYFILSERNFTKFLKKKVDSITTDWQGKTKHSQKKLNKLNSQKSIFSRTTNGIMVYDSLVIFEKHMQESKVAEIR